MFVNSLSGLRGNKEINILMLGLDNSGKTTILNKLKIGEIEDTTVAIGLIENAKLQNINFTIMSHDCLNEKFRPLWKYFSQNTKGLIFVVDSSDRKRIFESKDLLNKLLQDDELKDTALLVFANKQDLPGSLKVWEIKDLLGLTYNYCFIKGTCLTDFDNLLDGLNWLSNELQKKELSNNNFNKNVNDDEDEDYVFYFNY